VNKRANFSKEKKRRNRDQEYKLNQPKNHFLKKIKSKEVNKTFQEDFKQDEKKCPF